MAFDPTQSILAGMADSVLQAKLAAHQAAYLELTGGASVATASYAQGDGTKSVTFRETDLGKLSQTIRLLQAQLGIVCSPRAAIGVRFGSRYR